MRTINSVSYMRSLTGAYSRSQIRENEGIDPFDRVAWDSHVNELLHRQSYTYDPTSPLADRWIEKDYWEARVKFLAVLDSARLEADAGEKSFSRALDQGLTNEILNIYPVTLYEAGLRGTWEYLTLRVVPEIALQRWAKPGEQANEERLLGGDRNALKRIWIRAYAAGSNPRLLDRLMEDNLTAIFERPKVIANPAVAAAVLKVLNNYLDLEKAAVPFEALVRDFMLRLRRVMSVRTLDVLNAMDLEAELQEICSLSAASLQERRAATL